MVDINVVGSYFLQKFATSVDHIGSGRQDRQAVRGSSTVDRLMRKQAGGRENIRGFKGQEKSYVVWHSMETPVSAREGGQQESGPAA